MSAASWGAWLERMPSADAGRHASTAWGDDPVVAQQVLLDGQGHARGRALVAVDDGTALSLLQRLERRHGQDLQPLITLASCDDSLRFVSQLMGKGRLAVSAR